MRAFGRGIAAGLGCVLTALVLAMPAYPAFPGGNGKIVFDSSRGAGVGLDVFSIEADGSSLTQLTDLSLDERRPVWSADGTRIAFDAESPAGIYTMNADGTGRTRLTDGGIDPSWSPDGDEIAFMCCSAAAGPLDVWLMNSDGSNQRRFLPDRTGDRKGHPAWSPDGSRIAFITDRDRSQGVYNIEIFVAGFGGGFANVSNNPRDDLHPVWSPDGSKIAFDRDFAIWVMNADGSNQQNLTGSVSGEQPAWSPDGTKIAFRTGGPTPGAEIAVMNADGSGLHTITQDSFFDEFPDWQPLKRAPDCSKVPAAPDSIEHAVRPRFVPVALSGASGSNAVSIRIDGVTQDEPVTSEGDPTSPDAQSGPAADRIQLRAERNPQGDGRVYRLSFTASDGQGGSCAGTATVSVPRHRDEPAVDSAPPSYDSFGS
jgi:dipeptidyl aminopeptidase/acylaminoacyl peptidase